MVKSIVPKLLLTLLLQIILLPFSMLYGLITAVRNKLFDVGVLRSTAFQLPIISIGNLSVGGTGKTPHTEYLLDFLSAEWKVAVLSRGYKRKSKGFRLAVKALDDALTIGDEPFQIFSKYPDIQVAVDEKRVHGVTELLLAERVPELVLLDDAFQHRFIRPGFSILLTDFSNLYTRDRMLPAGRLREWASGSKRANFIVVTKCPADLAQSEAALIQKELNALEDQTVFFSTFNYKSIVPVFPEHISDIKELDAQSREHTSIVFVAGIVNPAPAMDYLSSYTNKLVPLFYPDHYQFLQKDYRDMEQQILNVSGSHKLFVVTEKDAARIRSASDFPSALKAVTYALPIGVKILFEQDVLFIQKIRDYVIENTRNS